MDGELEQKIANIESKINDIHKTIQLGKKMLVWSTVISLLLFIIPLIILIIALPTIMNSMSAMYGGLL